MAARRLVVVMLVLLFVSSLAAALAPVRQAERLSSSSTTTETAMAPSAQEGRLVQASLDAGARRPRVVDRLAVGDQLQLRVEGSGVATVEIPALGATESVGPLTPARFDLLLREAGDHDVRILETGRRIGTLEVSPRRNGS